MTYEELLQEIKERMEDLKNDRDQLDRVIVEVMDKYLADVEETVNVALGQSLGYVISEIYNCTIHQVAYNVLDHQLGQDWLKDAPEDIELDEMNEDTDMIVTVLINDETMYNECQRLKQFAPTLNTLANGINTFMRDNHDIIYNLSGGADPDLVNHLRIAQFFWYEDE